ncbi:hypothetical protein A3860_38005 [Niastella vici]|uniref:Secretin/TonB short N-terminal domain-containing protein n=1 Tax=Niastella vici TaxID=1703345 RepID=A0A1V9FLT3_9BACT|nr:STN domain-containing protein [Niastella vici]OQP59251.1 hypothetical protein A3860_38005 [Niastella vici]
MQVFATRKAAASGSAVRKQTSHHVVRIMKVTVLILLFTSLPLRADGASQPITLSLKDAPLQQVFKEIEKQTDYTFISKDDFMKKAIITVMVNNVPIDQVLDLCLKDQSFRYSISGKIITISPKKELGTGNVSPVKCKEIEKQPVNDPLAALQSWVPAITIEQCTVFTGSRDECGEMFGFRGAIGAISIAKKKERLVREI